MQKRMLAVVALTALLLLAVGVVAGCGGDTTTYANDEYGFSFDYDSGTFSQSNDVSPAGVDGGGGEVSVGLVDPDGTKQGETYRDGAFISVHTLGWEIDDLSEHKGWLEGQLQLALGNAGAGITAVSLKEVDVGGVKGYTTDASYSLEGQPFKARLYFFADGSKLYWITLQAADDRWSELEPKLQDVVDSFTVGGSE